MSDIINNFDPDAYNPEDRKFMQAMVDRINKHQRDLIDPWYERTLDFGERAYGWMEKDMVESSFSRLTFWSAQMLGWVGVAASAQQNHFELHGANLWSASSLVTAFAGFVANLMPAALREYGSSYDDENDIPD